jgi:hypothetical protein
VAFQEGLLHSVSEILLVSFYYYMVPTCRAQQFDSMHCPHLGIMPITSEGNDSDTSIQINTLALKYLKHGDQGGYHSCFYAYASHASYFIFSVRGEGY